MNQTREKTRIGGRRSEKRLATERVTLRFLPLEMLQLRNAVKIQSDPWRGLSYHLRMALITWATAMLSPVADARKHEDLDRAKVKDALGGILADAGLLKGGQTVPAAAKKKGSSADKRRSADKKKATVAA